ncbi:MAG: nucleotidyltransferase family protein [Candidatus Electrothrix sp. Rat3]|nr:nucleotidyltransferase family protein [Candidatus Electrothrix rattekaaiensis]
MFPLLHLCARIEPHPLQQKLLVHACARFQAWDGLLQQAEVQGMAPLLLRHLLLAEINPPDHILRSLRLLALRHRQSNGLLSKTLAKVLTILESAGIPVLVLKGAALCQTLYPDPGLRPMRDIDLLVPWDQALPAHTLLQQHGFHDPAVFTPEDHLHLAALYQEVDGIQVCLELHRSLFPDCPPCPKRIDFSKLYERAKAFEVNEMPAFTLGTLGNEDMLWHLYQHGFHAPLPYDPFKLISAADIIGFVEARLDVIDWNRITSHYPPLLAALPQFHHLSPWNEAVQERLEFGTERRPSGVGKSFTGWPRRKLAKQKGRGIGPILRDTFLPPDWWLRIYYAPKGQIGRLWSLIVQHPLHVFWWIKLYWAIFLKETLPEENISVPMKLRDIVIVVKNSRTLIAALYRKTH